MALTKNTPETIAVELKHTAMGVENTIMLTYFNRSVEEYDAFANNTENYKIPKDVVNEVDGFAHLNATIVLFLVKSFDDATAADFPLTYEGLLDLERTWPGTLIGIVKGYHQSRGAAVEKNSVRR